MKNAKIILRGTKYELEKLSEKTFKIHYFTGEES